MKTTTLLCLFNLSLLFLSLFNITWSHSNTNNNNNNNNNNYVCVNEQTEEQETNKNNKLQQIKINFQEQEEFQTNDHSPLLYANPTTLKQSGDSVVVGWIQIPNPQPDDFLGLYTPPPTPLSKLNDKKFHQEDIPDDKLNENEIFRINITRCNTWKKGYGALEVPLINMRSNYAFRYVRSLSRSSGDNKPLAQSNTIHFSNPNEPTQGHLSFGLNPSEMTLMWVSNSTYPSPQVKYGSRSGHYDHQTIGNTTTYSRDELCGAPATTAEGWRHPGYMHTVSMSRLEPGQEYFYIFGNDEHGWSPEYKFRAASPPGAVDSNGNPSRLEIVAFGDMGVFGGEPHSYIAAKETSYWIKDDVLKNGFGDLILHIGDISYSRGFGYIWDLFFASVESVATRIPYMVCVGNHEYDWPTIGIHPEWGRYGEDSGGECGIPYNRRFAMPAPPNEQHRRNWWYSFDNGPVHFVLMSTEQNFTQGSEQYKWMEQDLKNVDRRKTPWIIFSGHRPMYSSAATKSISIQHQFRKEIEPMLVRYKVDLALWGHIHAYERTCPVYKEKCAQSGEHLPTHVVIGMAGNDYQVPWKPKPEWSVYRSHLFGYTRIIVEGNTLHFQYVGDKGKTILDEFQINH